MPLRKDERTQIRVYREITDTHIRGQQILGQSDLELSELFTLCSLSSLAAFREHLAAFREHLTIDVAGDVARHADIFTIT